MQMSMLLGYKKQYIIVLCHYVLRMYGLQKQITEGDLAELYSVIFFSVHCEASPSIILKHGMHENAHVS